MDDKQLDYRHNFIQVLFPTEEVSGSVRASPVVQEEDLPYLESHPEQMSAVQTGMLLSLDRMLKFYGLQRYGDGSIGPGRTFISNARWTRPGDHNALRFTRMIACGCSVWPPTPTR